MSTRRDFMKCLGWGTASLLMPWPFACTGPSPRSQAPNFIVIFCDDLGYGDLGTFGHPTIRTPHLDRMVSEGQKWTSFYVAASVCTPSRAALLTGRLPIRSGMCDDANRVLFPNSTGGLPAHEITIAEALKPVGYATGCVGKWHLGHHPQHLPTRHGFDSYFGIPYSNDMDAVASGEETPFLNPKIEYWNVPLMRDEEVIERPADQKTLTQRYTQSATDFIQEHVETPFFLYLAHTFPHIPLFRSPAFQGKSLRGLYGDVIEEIDASTGRILDTLREAGLAENTLVIFTSDNGPWLPHNEQGGSAGLLKGGKGSTWEGGMREPTIFWWPGQIAPGVVMDMGSTLDLLPTLCSLGDAPLPDDRILDGYDLSPTLLRGEPGPRHIMFYYRGTRLYAVRKGPFKAHFTTEPGYGADRKKIEYDPPLLFNLEHDPSEKYNIAANHPQVIADILLEVERHRADLIFGKDQLAERVPQK